MNNKLKNINQITIYEPKNKILCIIIDLIQI